MEHPAFKKDLLRKLQEDILSMQGYKAAPDGKHFESGLGNIETAFPNNAFPTGAIHEFLSTTPADAACTNSFIVALAEKLVKENGICLWIGSKRTLFPPALRLFGMRPENVVFVDLKKEKEILWTIEEALKCPSVTAVVGELSDISFMESRRLQLAVEDSHVTGFIHRYKPKAVQNLACVSRWKIQPLPSLNTDGLPGVGNPCWNIELLKVRNGRPGVWQMEWVSDHLQQILPQSVVLPKVKMLRAV